MHIDYGRFTIFEPRRSAAWRNELHNFLTVCNKRHNNHLHFSVADNHVIHRIVPQIMNHISRLLSFLVGDDILLKHIKYHVNNLSAIFLLFFSFVAREFLFTPTCTHRCNRRTCREILTTFLVTQRSIVWILRTYILQTYSYHCLTTITWRRRYRKHNRFIICGWDNTGIIRTHHSRSLFCTRRRTAVTIFRVSIVTLLSTRIEQSISTTTIYRTALWRFSLFSITYSIVTQTDKRTIFEWCSHKNWFWQLLLFTKKNRIHFSRRRHRICKHSRYKSKNAL